MTPFRERNPVPIGIGGILAILLLLLITFNISKVPFISNETQYAARFSEAAGISKENEVRIAGVRKGTVSDIQLDGQSVIVKFRLERDVVLGDKTRAAIKLKTLLGTKFLDLQPDGPGKLPKGAVIPLERTEVPFQIYDAFNQLSETTNAIDVDALAKALRTLSATFRDPEGNTQSALTGLSKLSKAIADRDDELGELLASTNQVTAAVAARDSEIVKLIGDADLVLQLLNDRRTAIASLLANTARLSTELTSLIRDNRAQLDPLLANLHSVVEVLRANLAQLERSVQLLGPFSRLAANSNGNGRWLDVYSENFVVTDEILCMIGAC